MANISDYMDNYMDNRSSALTGELRSYYIQYPHFLDHVQVCTTISHIRGYGANHVSSTKWVRLLQ